MRWILELDIFGEDHPLRHAAMRAGHEVVRWDDAAWLDPSALPSQSDGPTLFHGSLGNAHRIAKLGRWRPGAYCTTAAFKCSAYYPVLKRWLLNQDVTFTTVRDLIETANAETYEGTFSVFVRPDSPLKPFSGRVVQMKGLTPAHLDHGFYYDDLDLPIVVSPPQTGLGQEWRFVVAPHKIVASSAYVPEGRAGVEGDAPSEAYDVARQIVDSSDPPDLVYVVDLVETPDGFKLLEVNPFSGASLYRCDPDVIVEQVAAVALGECEGQRISWR